MSQSKHGFTLIELLLVVAIIAVLAALLFPVFSRARQRAYQATCASNLHQIGIAIQSYAEDWDGGMVHSLSGPSYTHWYYFPDMLDPYIRSADIWYCSAGMAEWDLSPDTDEYHAAVRKGWPEGIGPRKRHLHSSYRINSWVGQSHDPLYFLGATTGKDDITWPQTFLYQDRELSDFTNPTGTILLLDSTPQSTATRTASSHELLIWSQDQTDVCGPYTPSGADGNPQRGWVSYRHSGGFNTLFVDGHVKRLRKTTWEMWAFDPKVVPVEDRTYGCKGKR